MEQSLTYNAAERYFVIAEPYGQRKTFLESFEGDKIADIIMPLIV